MKYYILESGEILKKAEEYRTKYFERKEQLRVFIKEIGAETCRIDPFSMELVAVGFKGDVLKGFCKPDKEGMTRPFKRNKELSKFFLKDGLLKEFQPMVDFCDWLGCPTSYRFKIGDKISGSQGIGSSLFPIGLYWYSRDRLIMLRIPDIEHYDKLSKENGEFVTNNVLSWRMTHKGVKEILREKWDLIVAEYERGVEGKPEKLFAPEYNGGSGFYGQY